MLSKNLRLFSPVYICLIYFLNRSYLQLRQIDVLYAGFCPVMTRGILVIKGLNYTKVITITHLLYDISLNYSNDVANLVI